MSKKPAFPTIQQARAGHEDRTPSRTFRALGQGGRIKTVPLDRIAPNPANPRKAFDPDALQALADSIAARGILQPPVVRPADADGIHTLIMGERRTRAARLAGLAEIDVLIGGKDDAGADLEDALIENLDREDLSPVEIARGYATLIEDLGITREELARRMGRKISRSTISNHIRLLDLPAPILAAVDDGRLSFAHGRALLSVQDHNHQKRLARQAIDQGWSKRTLENAAAELSTRPARKRVSPADRVAIAENRDASDRLTDQLALAGHAAAVKVTQQGITISLKDLDAAEKLAAALTAASTTTRR